MSGELEAAGALATAGLAAGAIEGRGSAHAGEGACLNCGAALAGRYCAQCGQAAHAHRTLSHMFEEVLHGLFHFDTKAWRTLPMLVGRPGTLTRNYIYGKRARYISPLALFLFTIFLMFFVFAFVELPISLGQGTRTQVEASDDLAQAREELAQARAELTQAQAAGPDEHTGDLEVRLARQAVALAEAQVARRERQVAQMAAAEAQKREAGPPPPAGRAPSHEAQTEGATAGGAHEGETWQEELSRAAREGKITVGTPFPQLNARVLHSLENPDLALYKIVQAAYKFSFLLVPISLPFMWLLFIWRRGLTLYDHAVFVLYSLAFASVLFVAVALSASAPWLEWAVPMLVGIGLPAHMFFHLKGAYALGWWSAIWRTLLLLVFAWLSLALFMIIIVVLGLGG